jgi:hypothetical protein
MRCAKSRIACIAFVVSLTSPGIAQAEGNERPLTDAWRPVSNAHLDQMRGGFDTGAGLRISFGIEREGYINGKLISATRINIADLDRLSAVQANAINSTLLRSGPGNAVDAGKLAPSATALVIQNTLNLQNIRSLTVINATANSLELIKSLNLQSTLADALAQSLGNR